MSKAGYSVICFRSKVLQGIKVSLHKRNTFSWQPQILINVTSTDGHVRHSIGDLNKIVIWELGIGSIVISIEIITRPSVYSLGLSVHRRRSRWYQRSRTWTPDFASRVVILLGMLTSAVIAGWWRAEIWPLLLIIRECGRGSRGTMLVFALRRYFNRGQFPRSVRVCAREAGFLRPHEPHHIRLPCLHFTRELAWRFRIISKLNYVRLTGCHRSRS